MAPGFDIMAEGGVEDARSCCTRRDEAFRKPPPRCLLPLSIFGSPKYILARGLGNGRSNNLNGTWSRFEPSRS